MTEPKPKHPQGSTKAWQEWNPPKALWEGQRVRVHRWQNRDGQEPNGHYEDGAIAEIRVELKGQQYPVRVAAVDLSGMYLAGSNKTRKSARPSIGIVMRNNMYWLKAYVVESLEQEEAWPPKPVVQTTSCFDGNPFRLL